jgi:hypothetical protein
LHKRIREELQLIVDGIVERCDDTNSIHKFTRFFGLAPVLKTDTAAGWGGNISREECQPFFSVFTRFSRAISIKVRPDGTFFLDSYSYTHALKLAKSK